MNGFTPVECAVAACLLDGMNDKQTAAATGWSASLVANRVRKLRERFRVTSRTSLVLELDRIAREPEVAA